MKKLNVVPTFLGIALLYGAVRLITKGNKGGL
jgi:hypothetical protein